MAVFYRADLDGITSVAMLIELGLCEESIQAHPKDIQDGLVEISDEDIICNLPYHPKCKVWYGRHVNSIDQSKVSIKHLPGAILSSARQIYLSYVSERPELKKYEPVIYVADMLKNGNLTIEQVRNPEGIVLFSYLLDPRTGLGFYHDFTISNYQWSSQLPELLTRYSVHEIMRMPDTRERISKYNDMEAIAAEFLLSNSHLEKNVISVDLRNKTIPPVNRFLIYTLPNLHKGTISVRIANGKNNRFDTISVGHSIYNRISTINSGELCRLYGGGGYKRAAACQPSLSESDTVFMELINACRE